MAALYKGARMTTLVVVNRTIREKIDSTVCRPACPPSPFFMSPDPIAPCEHFSLSFSGPKIVLCFVKFHSCHSGDVKETFNDHPQGQSENDHKAFDRTIAA